MEEYHTHVPIPGRVEMQKSYSNLKTAAVNSEQTTRVILSTTLETMHTTTINAFPKFESVKRTIRCYKSRGIESCGHPDNADGIIIPDKYKMTLKVPVYFGISPFLSYKPNSILVRFSNQYS